MNGETSAVCRRGHVCSYRVVDPDKRLESTDASRTPSPWGFAAAVAKEVDPFCGTCGAEVLCACEECGRAIPEVNLLSGPRKPRPFCRNCGQPFPWAGREERIHALLNVIDQEEDLSEADRFEIIDALAVLSKPGTEADEKSKVDAGKTVQRLAPRAWAVAQPVLVETLSSVVRKALGLP